MGIQTTLTITCDYSGCKGSKKGPTVVEYIKEAVESGQIPMPEEAKYLVIFNMGGRALSFCCQLHAAEFFLPPGYEVKQKSVIEIPVQKGEPKTTIPWTAHKLDKPMEMRSELEAIPQADGDCPNNGQTLGEDKS